MSTEDRTEPAAEHTVEELAREPAQAFEEAEAPVDLGQYGIEDWVAFALFIAAGVTDFFDGYFARIWGQQTTFGRMLDPIADKLLVASCLLVLAGNGTIKGLSLWAAVVILCREILVSGLREYLAGLRVSVPVTRLAKWKTTVQLVAIGFLIAGKAGDHIVPITTLTGLSLLWISALVTLYTGWDYLRAGVQHLIEE